MTGVRKLIYNSRLLHYIVIPNEWQPKLQRVGSRAHSQVVVVFATNILQHTDTNIVLLCVLSVRTWLKFHLKNYRETVPRTTSNTNSRNNILLNLLKIWMIMTNNDNVTENQEVEYRQRWIHKINNIEVLILSSLTSYYITSHHIITHSYIVYI